MGTLAAIQLQSLGSVLGEEIYLGQRESIG